MLPPGSICVELGVAAGAFSEAILRCENVAKLHSIDKWNDHHNEAEMCACQIRLKKFGERSETLRATFSQAVEMFDDDLFDFIYIDGYAHTGQEGGQTLEDWWPKLKPGGIFAGHDYHPEYQPTIDAVDAFSARHGFLFGVTGEGRYPSWWGMKGMRDTSSLDIPARM